LAKFLETGKIPRVHIKETRSDALGDNRVSTFLTASPRVGGSLKEVPRPQRVTIGRSASDVNVGATTINSIYTKPVALASTATQDNSTCSSRPSVYNPNMSTDKGVSAFNSSPKRGMEFLLASRELEIDPSKIADYLKTKKGLDKIKIGEYLGDRDELNAEVLDKFACSFSFEQMEFDLAMRHFLSFFRLPGESQVIERIVQKFAAKYYYDNQGMGFADADAAFVLAYSVIMLATDLHNKNVKVKMTFQQWVKNNSGCNNGGDFDEQFLRGIFDRILKSPIRTDDISTAPDDKRATRKPLLSFSTKTTLSNPKKFSVLLKKK